jgi:hypothetical protein
MFVSQVDDARRKKGKGRGGERGEADDEKKRRDARATDQPQLAKQGPL